MTWNNTPPATKALPGVTFANDAPAEKALPSVTFDNQAPAEKLIGSQLVHEADFSVNNDGYTVDGDLVATPNVDVGGNLNTLEVVVDWMGTGGNLYTPEIFTIGQSYVLEIQLYGVTASGSAGASGTIYTDSEAIGALVIPHQSVSTTQYAFTARSTRLRMALDHGQGMASDKVYVVTVKAHQSGASNAAPATKALPGVTFDNGAPTQKSVGAAEFTLLVDATEFATNGLFSGTLRQVEAATGALIDTFSIEVNSAIDSAHELDITVTEALVTVPGSLAAHQWLLITPAGYGYLLELVSMPPPSATVFELRVVAHLPGSEALAAASFSNGSPANKAMPGVTFANTAPAEKALAAAAFANDAPAEKAVAGATFANGAPEEKAVASATFANDAPAAKSGVGASWSNDAPAVIVLPGAAPVVPVVAPSSPIEVTYSETLANNQNYRVLVGTRSAPVTITLPDPGGTRQWIEIVDDGRVAATHAITVDPGTKAIDGDATPFVINRDGAVLEIYYTGTYWKIL